MLNVTGVFLRHNTLVVRLAGVILFASLAVAQAPPSPTPDSVAAEPVDKRVLGVLPNYRTVNGTANIEPISAKQKLTIAAKDSFDWPNYLVAGVFSGLYQLENTNPSFGQGVKGYLHRWGTSYGDQVIGNMLTEGFMPVLLHEDPRYFRRGTGQFWSRFRYSATRTLVTRTDTGGSRVNVSELLGNGISASIGNAYYPDGRGFSDTMSRMWTQVGTDTISNVLKEFWPDLKRHFKKKDAQP